MKKRSFLIILLLIMEVSLIFFSVKSFNNKPSEKLDDIKLLQAIQKNSLYSVMINDGTGNYTEENDFPSSNYILNKEKSKCIDSNGNTLEDELNFVNGNVEVTLDKTAFCYLYFDKNSETRITLTVSNGVTSSQTVQIEAEDEDGLAGVYYGMDNPEDTEVEYTEVYDSPTSKSWTFHTSGPGIYYFSVKDIHGMVTTTSREFFQTKFNVENGRVNPTSVLTLKGNSFILPTPESRNQGYTVSTTWHGNGTTYESGSTYTPTTNSTLTANSTQNSYNVTLTITNGKTTSVNPQTVLHGSSASFAITPNTGYDLVLASDTCSGTLSGSTYTVSNVTSAKSCAITLKKKTYSVKITVTNGSTSSTNPQTVEHGGSAKFTISAKSGYQLSLSSNGCGGTLSGSTYTISNVTSAKTCTIVLKTALAGDAIKALKPTGLETVARDGLYRFVGSSNNYVCLGACSDTTKYRIIGITDGSSGNTNLGISAGQLKVKRESSFGKTTWGIMDDFNTKWVDANYWQAKTIYTYLNITNKSSIIPSGWSDKISSVKWNMGDVKLGTGYYAEGTANEIYKLEAAEPTTATSQIGLVYLSDFSYSESVGGTTICKYNNSCKNSWMSDRIDWWTMGYFGKSGEKYRAWNIQRGTPIAQVRSRSLDVYPVFYLKNTVSFTGTGNGTSSNPYILS